MNEKLKKINESMKVVKIASQMNVNNKQNRLAKEKGMCTK